MREKTVRRVSVACLMLIGFMIVPSPVIAEVVWRINSTGYYQVVDGKIVNSRISVIEVGGDVPVPPTPPTPPIPDGISEKVKAAVLATNDSNKQTNAAILAAVLEQTINSVNDGAMLKSLIPFAVDYTLSNKGITSSWDGVATLIKNSINSCPVNQVNDVVNQIISGLKSSVPKDFNYADEEFGITIEQIMFIIQLIMKILEMFKNSDDPQAFKKLTEVLKLDVNSVKLLNNALDSIQRSKSVIIEQPNAAP
jgi:hypothetical protein